MPIDPKAKLVPNKNETKTNKIYYFQLLISSLLFLVLVYRPDIIFAIIKLARFTSNPSQDHV
jgi:hypothetical protein